jgi:uncharacterized protein YndB with AHSA1/START domain
MCRRVFAVVLFLAVLFSLHAGAAERAAERIEKGPIVTERAIEKEVIVAAPIEAVWQCWTSKAGIESFFAPEAEIEPLVGGAFHIHMDPFAAPGMKGADDMRFMALQPPKMLSFDWNAPKPGRKTGPNGSIA